MGTKRVLVKLGSSPQNASPGRKIPVAHEDPLRAKVLGQRGEAQSIIEMVVENEKLAKEPWENNRDFHVNNPSRNRIPPFERLEHVSKAELVNVFEMSPDEAEAFYNLPALTKRKVSEQCRRLNEMKPEQRGKMMHEYRRGLKVLGDPTINLLRKDDKPALTSFVDEWGVPLEIHSVSNRLHL